MLLQPGTYSLLLWLGALPAPKPTCAFGAFGFCLNKQEYTSSSAQLRISAGERVQHHAVDARNVCTLPPLVITTTPSDHHP